MKNLAIFSVPRSGSTWLGQIFNSSPEVIYRFQPNFAYSFPYAINENDSESDITTFYRQLKKTVDPFVCGSLGINGKKNIEFLKRQQTLLVWKEVHHLQIIETLLKKSDTKVIGLIRNPFAVINSWISIPKEFDPKWNIIEQWKHATLKNNGKPYNYFGYNKWKESCFQFLSHSIAYPERFIVCNYHSLLTSPLKTIEHLFSFAGMNLSEETKRFINFSTSSQDTNPYSVIKNKKVDEKWKKTLPKFIVEDIKTDPDFIALNKIFKWI